MTTLVSDTSGLVSLGIASGSDPDPLSVCLATYDVRVPTEVIEELQEIASYNDDHGQAATAVCDRTTEMTIQSVDLDAEFPLDDGENAAVTLANKIDAEIFLCDEFNSLGLIHASLANTRLVTTPTLLSVLVRTKRLATDEARTLLDEMSSARSWETNSYVQRARSLLGNPWERLGQWSLDCSNLCKPNSGTNQYLKPRHPEHIWADSVYCHSLFASISNQLTEQLGRTTEYVRIVVHSSVLNEYRSNQSVSL